MKTDATKVPTEVPASRSDKHPARQSRRIPMPGPKILFALMVLFGLVAPIFLYPIFLMKVMCYALFALAFNLLIGYGGLLSFGHAMFFGGASYFTGHMLKVWGWPTEISILAGVGVATLMGVFAGLVAIKRQGIYFAMVTLAIAQMFYFFSLQAEFTGGEDGIQNVPRTPVFGFIDIGPDINLYYFILVMFLIGFLIIHRTIHSPFGHILKAVKENEARATSLGYNIDHYKLAAFVISSAIAGLGGSLKVLVFQIATLTDVTWQMSGEPILMTLIGGLGTVSGPILGAAIVLAMQNYLAEFGEWVLVTQGVTFVVVVVLFRKGIVGEVRDRRMRKNDV